MLEAVSWATWQPSWQVLLGWKVVVMCCEGGYQHFWQILVEVPGLPLQADEHQPILRRLPLPSSQLHLLGDCARHAAPKTTRGQVTLDRLKVFDGISPPCNKKKWRVVPTALKDVRLKSTWKFVYIGRLAREIGWKYQAVTATLEKRKEKAKVHHRKRKQLMRLQAEKNMEKKTDRCTEVLKSYGLLVRAQ